MGCIKLSYLAEKNSTLKVVHGGRFVGGKSGLGAYRYGFNGKEKDSDGEWGNQTHYDYGFRIYNPGIGKFLSVDPLTKKYPELTPFQFASNTPIQAIDLDGLEGIRPPVNFRRNKARYTRNRAEMARQFRRSTTFHRTTSRSARKTSTTPNSHPNLPRASLRELDLELQQRVSDFQNNTAPQRSLGRFSNTKALGNDRRALQLDRIGHLFSNVKKLLKETYYAVDNGFKGPEATIYRPENKDLSNELYIMEYEYKATFKKLWNQKYSELKKANPMGTDMDAAGGANMFTFDVMGASPVEQFNKLAKESAAGNTGANQKAEFLEGKTETRRVNVESMRSADY